MHIDSIEQLKKLSIRVTDETLFISPTTNETITLKNCFSPAYKLKYAVKNNILSFIDEKKDWYVIPNLKGTTELLESLFYTQAGFYVPCSDNYYPLEYKMVWNLMLEHAQMHK